jgi:hypothetical protein
MTEQNKAPMHRKCLYLHSARVVARILASNSDDPERSRVERVNFILARLVEPPLASAVPTRREAQYFVGEKFRTARDCPETGGKRQMCGHIFAGELRRVSRCVSEEWTVKNSCARVELKKLSASGSALATHRSVDSLVFRVGAYVPILMFLYAVIIAA